MPLLAVMTFVELCENFFSRLTTSPRGCQIRVRASNADESEAYLVGISDLGGLR